MPRILAVERQRVEWTVDQFVDRAHEGDDWKRVGFWQYTSIEVCTTAEPCNSPTPLIYKYWQICAHKSALRAHPY